jgi:hypothetical protein
MARGLPAVWSTVVAVPFVAAGVYIAGFQSAFPLFDPGRRAPPEVGYVLVCFGLFVFGLGLYVHFVAAPSAPRMRDGEEVVDRRDPAQRNALAETFLSLPVLAVGGYLLYFTERPLVYPTVALAVGLYLFSRGVHRYWRNTLTTYFVTTQRVIEEYRFVSLLRNEVPHEKVRGVEERRSAWDSLFGLGDVAVRSGASGELTVSVDDVYDSTEFADVVRNEISPHADSGAGAAAGGRGADGAEDGNGGEGTPTADESAAPTREDGAAADADPGEDDAETPTASGDAGGSGD